MGIGEILDTFNVRELKTLTVRERQVLLLFMAELPLKQIGHELQINDKTASSYKRELMRKLGVASDVGLVRLAIACGL